MRVRRWVFFSSHTAEFVVQGLDDVLGATRSGYYVWRAGTRAGADRAAAEASLVNEIRAVRETRGRI